MQKGASELKSTNGDTHLGGEDFDIALITHILNEFKKENSIDLTSDRIAIQRVREAAEKVKIQLSSAQQTEINFPCIIADASGPKHINLKLNRSQFDVLIQLLVHHTIDPCKKALAYAGVKARGVSEVILVGSMSRMPRLRRLLGLSLAVIYPRVLLTRMRPSPLVLPFKVVSLLATSPTSSFPTSLLCRSVSKLISWNTTISKFSPRLLTVRQPLRSRSTRVKVSSFTTTSCSATSTSSAYPLHPRAFLRSRPHSTLTPMVLSMVLQRTRPLARTSR